MQFCFTKSISCDSPVPSLSMNTGSLAREIERLQSVKARLSSTQVLGLFLQLVESLAYLHEACNMAHRDVKPHNMLIRCSRSPSECFDRFSIFR